MSRDKYGGFVFPGRVVTEEDTFRETGETIWDKYAAAVLPVVAAKLGSHLTCEAAEQAAAFADAMIAERNKRKIGDPVVSEERAIEQGEYCDRRYTGE
jgi:hypothetical protein